MKSSLSYLWVIIASLAILMMGYDHGRADSPAETYGKLCGSCHGANGQGGVAPGHIGCGMCDSVEALYKKINNDMPRGNSAACVGECAQDMTILMRS